MPPDRRFRSNPFGRVADPYARDYENSLMRAAADRFAAQQAQERQFNLRHQAEERQRESMERDSTHRREVERRRWAQEDREREESKSRGVRRTAQTEQGERSLDQRDRRLDILEESEKFTRDIGTRRLDSLDQLRSDRKESDALDRELQREIAGLRQETATEDRNLRMAELEARRHQLRVAQYVQAHRLAEDRLRHWGTVIDDPNDMRRKVFLPYPGNEQAFYAKFGGTPGQPSDPDHILTVLMDDIRSDLPDEPGRGSPPAEMRVPVPPRIQEPPPPPQAKPLGGTPPPVATPEQYEAERARRFERFQGAITRIRSSNLTDDEKTKRIAALITAAREEKLVE